MNIKKELLFLAGFLITILSNAQQPKFEWGKSIGGTALDYGISITFDNYGNTYTTGTFVGTVDFDPGSGISKLSSGGSDIFILKLDAFGQFIWAKKLGGKQNDYGQAISSDKFGNIYTIGRFEGTADFNPGIDSFLLTSAGGGDVFISKLDSSGKFIWAKKMGGIEGDIGYCIAIDTKGNVYSTGHFTGTGDFDPGSEKYNLISSGYMDVFISKLDSLGNFVWARKIGGNSSSEALFIGLDGSGNVYTTGNFSGNADFDPSNSIYNLTAKGDQDIFISKLDNSGKFVWAKNFGGSSAFKMNHGYSLILDKMGYIYTTGYFSGIADFNPGKDTFNLISNGGSDMFILKLDLSGNFVWAKSIGSAGKDGGYGISLDSFGNVFTTGYFNGQVDFDPNKGIVNLTSNGVDDIFILKLNSVGNLVWVKGFGGDLNDEGTFITISKSGDIYTTGLFQSIIDCDPSSSVSNLTSTGGFDMFIHKMSKETIGLKNILINKVKCYPNPNYGTLFIDLTKRYSKDINIQLLNSFSQIVMEETSSNQNSTLNIQHLPSGLYFVKVTSDNNIIAMQKIIKQ